MSDLEEKIRDLEVESHSEDSDFTDSDLEDETPNNKPGSSNTGSVTTSKHTVDKAKILSKYSDRIKTDEFLFKQKQLSKDKADRATFENVMDPRTIGFVVKLIKKGTITRINGCLSTGKEANVYHAVNENTGKEYAVKIYKTSILVFKDRERYVDGEFRFRNSRSQHNPRKMIKIWAEKEFRNLKRLHASGMYSPEPIDLKSHVLVMEFLTGGDGFPSPKLRDYPFEDFEEITLFYHLMLHDIRYMYKKCRLVHADLSEYNSIVHQGKLYIFDVSQSVEPEHPMSLDFLRMDIKNVNDFFMKKGIDVVPERLIFKFVIEDLQTLGLENDSKEEIMKYIANMPIKATEADIENDEIFRSLHLVRSLNHLEERDFENFKKGKVDTLKSLAVEEGQDEDEEDDDKEENLDDSEEEESDDEEEDDDDDDEEEEEEEEEREREGKPKKEWVERPLELKGKKHEDKEAKKLRKQQAKDEAKEKRKTKMKKHVKKKLVNKGKSK